MSLPLKELFLLNNAQTSSFPRMLEVSKAKGVYIYDPSGKAYLDLVSGFAVSNIGHCHPNILAAINQQAAQYLHVTVYGEFVQGPQVLYAQKLISLLPKQLNSVYFTNSGAEAAEGAIKLAKRYTGRSNLIACKNSYHGSTHGALSLMGNELYKQAYRPLLPGISFINFNNLQDLEQITNQTAAIFVECIQGEAGVIVPDVQWMQALRKKCTETGTLLILDEIQSGFGRTGKFFGFEHYNIEPDVLLLAKGMGGGMPLGAFIAQKEIMDSLKDNPILGHITTFGGHPVSCAAALACLNTIIDEDLIAGVAQKEAHFKQLLKHPKITEIRGKGLMLSIQLQNFEQIENISKICLKNSLIIDWFLHCDTALRIAPPLIITEAQIVEACQIILNAIDEDSA